MGAQPLHRCYDQIMIKSKYDHNVRAITPGYPSPGSGFRVKLKKLMVECGALYRLKSIAPVLIFLMLPFVFKT